MIIQTLLAVAVAGFAGGSMTRSPNTPEVEEAARSSLCTPVLSDGHYGDSIQECLDDGPLVMTLPSGEFLVDDATAYALTVSRNNMSITGHSDGTTTIKLVRPVDLFSEKRVLQITSSNVSLSRLTIDGGMGAQTCEEAKYDEYDDGGRVPGSQGQQQHGIFVSGTSEAVDGLALSDVNFEGLSGDALFLYNMVENVYLTDMTIEGYCRSGLTMNGYTEHGINNIHVERVNFNPQSVAQASARGVDIEPNAYMLNLFFEDVRMPRFESGRVNGMFINGLHIESRNGIAGTTAFIGGRGDNFLIQNVTIDNTGATTSEPAFSLGMENGTVSGLDILNAQETYGIVHSGVSGYFPSGAVFEGITLNGVSSYVFYSDGAQDLTIRGLTLDDGGVAANTLNGKRGIFFFGGQPDSELAVSDTDMLDGGVAASGDDPTSVFVRAFGPMADGGYSLGGVYLDDVTGPANIYVNSQNGSYPDMELQVCNSTFAGQNMASNVPCP